MGNTPQSQSPSQFDPNAAYASAPQNLPADATHFYDKNTGAVHKAPEQPAFDPNAGYQPAPEKPGILSRAWNAATDEVGSIASGVNSLAHGVGAGPEDANEVAAHAGGGQGGLVAYRLAKGVADGTQNLVKAKKENFHQAAKDLQSAVINLHNKNYGSALADTVSTAAGAMGLTDPAVEAGRARDIAQGAKPGGDMVTPIVKDAVDLGAAAAMEKAPEVGAKVIGKAGDALNVAKNAKIQDIKPEWLTKRPETPAAQHGQPVRIESPIDSATVGKQLGGKDLSTDALGALQGHVGNTIPVGSSARNLLTKAVEPTVSKINELSSKLNATVKDSSRFTTSVAQDAGFGESTLHDEMEALKKNLPASERGKLSLDIDDVLKDADDALNEQDPQKVLNYRRILGQKIDWDAIERNPSTPGEVQNAARAKVYKQLTNKIHDEIPATVELDKQLQPQLELRSHLAKKVGSRALDDPLGATVEHESEFAKGKTAVENQIHNEQVSKNWQKVKAALIGLGIGAGAIHEIEKFL